MSTYAHRPFVEKAMAIARKQAQYMNLFGEINDWSTCKHMFWVKLAIYKWLIGSFRCGESQLYIAVKIRCRYM